MKSNTETKEPKKMWKIEGEAFEKVKAARIECRAAKEEAQRLAEAAHKKLWDTVSEVLPESDPEAHLALDIEAEQLGFYIVKESDCGCGPSGGLLGAILAAAKKAS